MPNLVAMGEDWVVLVELVVVVSVGLVVVVVVVENTFGAFEAVACTFVAFLEAFHGKKPFPFHQKG